MDPPQQVIAKRVGRYVVIEQIGAGGMGVVYAAYDPKLDRKIAIKLLRANAAGGAGKLLREAQAMAKISHPNVISVFDVGTDGGEVYIAMEFADGGSLRAWLREVDTPRPWREVLRRFGAAGKGLAAAHEAGLVHGDFKPDNVLLGMRGEVGVVDFGLARPGSTTPPPSERSGDFEPEPTSTHETAGVYGTPAYMAPEQFRHDPPDERSDQFSFCVALYEGLFGERPFAGTNAATIAESVLHGRIRATPRGSDVPGWLVDVVVRGLAVAADRRWASMRELLGALQSDPTRRRRIIIGVAAAAMIGAGVGASMWTHHRLVVEGCHDAGEALAEVWGDDQRTALAAALAASGAANAEQTFAKTVPWLDAYATTWSQGRTEVCLAGRVDKSMTVEMHDAARECLDDLRSGFEVRVELLLAADAAAVQRAVQLAAGLPPLSQCRDERALQHRPRRPTAARETVDAVRRELVSAEAHMAAGKLDAGTALAREGLTRAETLAWPPLVAEAKLLLGQLRAKAGEYAEGERLLQEAALLAGGHDHDAVAADASIVLSQVVGYEQAEFELGMTWSSFAGMYVDRLDEAEGLRGAWHTNALGAIYAGAGRHAEAAAAFERAVELRQQVFGPTHPDVAASLSNLAGMLQNKGDLDAALATFRRALDIEIELLGENHPNVADSYEGIGNVHVLRGEGEEALAAQMRSLEIRTATLGPDHADTGDALLMVANALEVSGNVDACREYTLRAVQVHERALGPKHPTLALSLANLGAVYYHADEFDEAAEALERAAAIQREVHPDGHPDLVITLNTLGNVQRMRKDYAAASALYVEALALGERTLTEDHPLLAFPLTGRGQTLLEEGRPAEAVVPLERARAIRANPDVPSHMRSFTAFHLAQALWDADLDRARALSLAEEAAKSYAAGGEAEAEDFALVQRWLEQHEGASLSSPQR